MHRVQVLKNSAHCALQQETSRSFRAAANRRSIGTTQGQRMKAMENQVEVISFPFTFQCLFISCCVHCSLFYLSMSHTSNTSEKKQCKLTILGEYNISVFVDELEEQDISGVNAVYPINCDNWMNSMFH